MGGGGIYIKVVGVFIMEWCGYLGSTNSTDRHRLGIPPCLAPLMSEVEVSLALCYGERTMCSIVPLFVAF